jgi:hypothetical protein
MSSTPISYDFLPKLPNIGYYDTNESGNSTDKDVDSNFTSSDTLSGNLSKSCGNSSWSTTDGIYKTSDVNTKYLPNGSSTPSLDVPYFLAKEGVLTSGGDETPSLTQNIKDSCSSNQEGIVNQIQYLTCQLQQFRNREYNSSDFSITSSTTVKGIFQQFPNLKTLLIFIFIISIYFGISGFFGSMDVVGNVFKAVEKSNDGKLTYWIGLLVGLAVPMIILCSVYATMVCNNINELKKYEITNNAYGVPGKVDSELKKFDILTLVLFVLFIYAFVAVLFTIKSSSFSPIIYTIIVGSVLFVISIFIFILYAFIPFFDSANPDNMKDNTRELRLFIDSQTKESNITSNLHSDKKVRHVFFITAIIVFIMALIFFIMRSKKGSGTSGSAMSFLTGFLGSSAILIMPILWVFNFLLVIQLFYIYPILLLIMRFIRYGFMFSIYMASEKKPSMKDNFSDDLIEKLNNFKNYSPTWGLIGVDEIKLLLNMLGFENIFSSSIVSENNNTKNVSDNRHIASGFLGFLAFRETNKTGLIYSIGVCVLTFIISAIILYGIVKV